MNRQPNSSVLAVLVASGYLVVGVLWIMFSDAMVSAFTDDPALIAMLQTWKGLAFITASALVIFAFIWWYDTRRMEQERRLDTVFAAASDAFAILDRDWRILYANPKASQFSKAADHIVGMDVWEAFPEMLGTRFEEAYRQAMRERTETDAVDLLPGYNVWFEARAVPVPEGLAVFGRDITVQKLAERSRRVVEDRFNRFLDNLPMAAWIADAEATVLWASRGFHKEVGAGADPTGRKLEDIFGPAGRGALWNGVDMVSELQKPLVSVETLSIHAGVPRQYLVHRFGVDEVPATYGFVATRVEEDATADRLRNELDAMIHAVSHDLRAPLRGLTGFSDALAEEYGHAFDEDGARYLQRIHDAAGTMNALIDGLLQLSRVGRAELALETVDVAEFVRADLGRLQRQDPGREVVVEIPDELEVVADRGLMRQAMGQLLDNAWKFTAGRKTLIRLAEERRDGERVVVISDNGVGFDMANVGKLFTPFQRLHGVTEFAGVGIGLSVVHRIIRRHDGRVWLESRPGEGTSVRFTLGSEPDG